MAHCWWALVRDASDSKYELKSLSSYIVGESDYAVSTLILLLRRNIEHSLKFTFYSLRVSAW